MLQLLLIALVLATSWPSSWPGISAERRATNERISADDLPQQPVGEPAALAARNLIASSALASPQRLPNELQIVVEQPSTIPALAVAQRSHRSTSASTLRAQQTLLQI